MTELGGLELVVEKLVPDGVGLAHLPDGQVLLVRGAAPGDRIRLTAVEKQRGALWAVGYELLQPSSQRIQPECPVAERCGGCDLMHLSREAELEQKSSILREALERVGGVSAPSTALASAGDSAGYRSRVRFHVGLKGKLGFFARGSRQLVEVPSCVVADPRINHALGTIRRLARRFPEALAGFSDVELRATEAGVTARFVARDGIKPVAADPLLRALAKELTVAASERDAAALVERRRLGDNVYVEIPSDAFSQINVAVNQLLVDAVREGARARQLSSFCDLFAGVGNFALPLARLGLSGVMVDRTSSAVAAAKRALAQQGLTSLKARCADAARALADLVREGQRFDLLVLDPPREGAPDLTPGILALEPRAVAYVACDPVTLSRDLRPLLAAGLRIEDVQAFDMFPRTHHFETLIWLGRPEQNQQEGWKLGRPEKE
ncbi:MAG TPA: RsmD family RNA methyltransferase [Polyangiaceae bacterium]|nr:RsmD family RNA methyltransferase [Polyangiaceae bacterium]